MYFMRKLISPWFPMTLESHECLIVPRQTKSEVKGCEIQYFISQIKLKDYVLQQFNLNHQQTYLHISTINTQVLN